MDATADFGTGLRAHLGLEAAPADTLELEPERAAPARPVAAAEPPAAHVGASDGDLEALAALEDQLLARERAVTAREAALAARAEALLAEAQALHDAVVAPHDAPDELARRRALRTG